MFNKSDLLPDDEAEARARALVRKLRTKAPWFLISAINGRGCKQLSGQVYAFLSKPGKAGGRRAA